MPRFVSGENILTGGVDDLVKSWNWRDDFLEYKATLEGKHFLGTWNFHN